MYKRLCNPSQLKSFFLFGARGTCKSTLLHEMFPAKMALWFDLNDLDIEARIVRAPEQFEQEILSKQHSHPELKWVVVDEIQRCPILLNTIQRLIGQGHFKFALTGSSARKLKRGSANLLAGRALENFMFPLTEQEIGTSFDLNFCLRWGSLPEVFALPESERAQYLRTYVNTYLKEEIQSEQIVRNMPVFRAFIEVAAQSSGKILNYSNIARDVGSDSVTIKNYFSVLEDTLLGFYLPPFSRSLRKRQGQHPKFYFFDLGVTNAAQGLLTLEVTPQTSRYGELFEEFVICEIHRLNAYLRADFVLSYLITHAGVEVDLIVERPGAKTVFIEIKSTTKVTAENCRSLQNFESDFPDVEYILFSLDPREQRIGKVQCVPWKVGIERLGLPDILW